MSGRQRRAKDRSRRLPRPTPPEPAATTWQECVSDLHAAFRKAREAGPRVHRSVVEVAIDLVAKESARRYGEELEP